MKKTIRRKVFETNSSSTHSISISNGITDSIIAPDYDNIIRLTGGDFGWEQCIYHNAMDKANYCAQDQEYNEDNLVMLKEVIEEHTGYPVEIDLYGYIDHQSKGTSNEAFENKETLENFIFNSNCYIETDNDNHY